MSWGKRELYFLIKKQPSVIRYRQSIKPPPPPPPPPPRALHLGTPHHPQGRGFPPGYLSAPTSPAADTGTSASRRPVHRLPDRGPWFFHPLLRPLLPRFPEGGGEAASVPAGLRARRFAEKQYTRRLVRPWALLGGQLCSKWWKMREIRQPRDLAGLRGSWLERRGGNTESPL